MVEEPAGRLEATPTVAIVTDSTCGLPAELIAELGIGIVPLRVNLGSRTATDGVEITTAEVAAALNAKYDVTTSRPNPEEFAAAYARALESGATHVVAVTISAAISGTWESATLAAQDFGHGVVRVVDSRGTAMALGHAVLAASGVAASGAEAAQVQAAAIDVVDRTRTLFYVDTLEYLRRGGRVGTAASLLATSLSVKPLLQMVEGRVVPLEKVRTSTKAIARLLTLAAEAAGNSHVDIAVHHVGAPERAESVAAQLRERVTGIRELHVGELGAVIGTHLGAGAIGIVIVRR